MKKLVIKLVAIAIIGLVLLLTAGYFLVPPATKKAVDEGSRFAFGVPASIGSIGASPGIGATSVGFSDYQLSSPTGFEEPLLTIGKFNLGVGTKSLIGGTKDVNEFVLEGVELNLIQDGTQSNLLPVLRHLQGLGGDAAAEEGTTDREGSAGPKLRVDTIRVAGIKARLQLKGIPGVAALDQTFEVPAYEQDWSSITGEDGKTVAEIAGLLIDDLKERALAGADGHVPDSMIGALRKTLDGGLEGGLGAGLAAGADAAKEALEGEVNKAVEGLEDKAQDAADKLKGEAEKALGGAKEEASKALDGLLDGKDSGGLKGLFKGGGR